MERSELELRISIALRDLAAGRTDADSALAIIMHIIKRYEALNAGPG